MVEGNQPLGTAYAERIRLVPAEGLDQAEFVEGERLIGHPAEQDPQSGLLAIRARLADALLFVAAILLVGQRRQASYLGEEAVAALL